MFQAANRSLPISDQFSIAWWRLVLSATRTLARLKIWAVPVLTPLVPYLCCQSWPRQRHHHRLGHRRRLNPVDSAVFGVFWRRAWPIRAMRGVFSLLFVKFRL